MRKRLCGRGSRHPRAGAVLRHAGTRGGTEPSGFRPARPPNAGAGRRRRPEPLPAGWRPPHRRQAPTTSGFPSVIVAFCSGTLIHERAFLTAGHCTGPGSFAPLPPFIQVFVSLSPNALDPSTWRPVVEQVTHPSIPPCPPPPRLRSHHSGRLPRARIPGISDLGLVIPRRAGHAASARPGWRRSMRSSRAPGVTIADDLRGIWIPELSVPAEKSRRPPSGTAGGGSKPRRWIMSLTTPGPRGHFRAVSASAIPAAPTFFNAQPFSRPFDLSLVAVASDGGIDCISPDYRARVDTTAVQRWIRDTIRQHVSGSN